MSKPFYSFGIIFKNEIRCLERCLKSLKSLRETVPCEVVMADTGSTDGSREVAERYADILFDFPWCDDFSAARNAVMDRCSGQWYFSIDADEWLAEDIKELVMFSKATVRSNFGGIMIRNYKSIGPDRETNYMDFTGIRLARLSTGARYRGCIHEMFTMPDGSKTDAAKFGSTLLYHDGYAFASDADMQAKDDRNIKLLNKKLAENPEDLQTLTECIQATRHLDDTVSAEYARRTVDIIRRKEEDWEKKGPTVYRDIVSVAKLHKLPELNEWADEACELFSRSIFVRIDISYYMLAQRWDEKDYEGCIKWGEAYRAGLSDYRLEKYDPSESLRGVLEYSSPYWERRLLILLADSYIHLKEYDRSFAVLQEIDGSQLDEGQQVDACVKMLLHLHRMAELDTETLMARFWEQINQPEPSENMAEKRKAAFINTAAAALTPHYREDEAGREGFLRHGYTALIPLEGTCVLGDGAALLNTSDTAELENKLAKLKLEDVPISAIAHALECGIAFPLPEKTMSMEKMDTLAGRLVPLGGLLQLAEIAPQKGMQTLCWRRALLLAAVRGFDWKEGTQGLALARAFAGMERQFLPLCYAQSALTKEGLFLLPPLHRFGFYCAQAFEALDKGDTAGYIHLLREGLSVCAGVKDMVEFLLDHTPELQATPEPSAELKALADQIRTVLANFSPDDPAVAALKQSEAYQKVAYLIEGIEAPVAGGLLQ